MAIDVKKDPEPWTPRTENKPVFINSADYERGLGEESKPPDIDVAEEGSEDAGTQISPAAPPPAIKRPR